MSFFRKEKVNPIDKSIEFNDWNKSIDNFKKAIEIVKPIENASDVLKRDMESFERKSIENVKSIENAVVTEVKTVEKSIENLEQNTSIQITKSLKELLRSKRQGTESYAETIKRLANL